MHGAQHCAGAEGLNCACFSAGCLAGSRARCSRAIVRCTRMKHVLYELDLCLWSVATGGDSAVCAGFFIARFQELWTSGVASLDLAVAIFGCSSYQLMCCSKEQLRARCYAYACNA